MPCMPRLRSGFLFIAKVLLDRRDWDGIALQVARCLDIVKSVRKEIGVWNPVLNKTRSIFIDYLTKCAE